MSSTPVPAPRSFLARLLHTDTRAVDYPNALDYAGYAAMHLACLGVVWTGVTWRDLAVCAVSYGVRMFGLMAGYHRYFSHRSFRTSRTFQFVLALLGTLGVQKGVLWWASHHRYHHRYSDTEHDLHSPVQHSFLYAHSGWFLDGDNRHTDYARVHDLARYPELVWLNNRGLWAAGAYALLLLLLFGWSGLVWGFFVSTVLIWHAIHAIGSFGHRFGGYRRFATTDNSRNKWFLALVLMGEGWHNNHHYYPSSARQGFVWWELDLAYLGIRALEKLGLVWDVRVPPEHVIHADDPRAQAQVRRFEQWLVRLRLALAERVDAWAPPEHSTEEVKVLKQRLEDRLDALGVQALDQLLRDPEQLAGSWAALGADVAREAERLEGGAALASDLAEALRASLAECPVAHFLAPGGQGRGRRAEVAHAG
jgi:stearoyl-CoA desaturase (Delta-9 desaturase)